MRKRKRIVYNNNKTLVKHSELYNNYLFYEYSSHNKFKALIALIVLRIYERKYDIK